MLAAEPDRSRPAKPGLLRVTPRVCGPVLPAAEPLQPDKESWSSPYWRSPRWRRPSCGYGAGVSGPDAQDQDQLYMLAARPDWARPAKLCLLRVVPRTRGPCAARRGVLELFILVLSTLAARPAVVWELA